MEEIGRGRSERKSVDWVAVVPGQPKNRELPDGFLRFREDVFVADRAPKIKSVVFLEQNGFKGREFSLVEWLQ